MSLNKLIKVAKQSKMNYKHATIILKGGNIIAAACNTKDVHSEIRALKQLWPGYAKGTTVINIRLTKIGFGLSYPCNNCLEALRREKVRKIIYSDSSGVFHE